MKSLYDKATFAGTLKNTIMGTISPARSSSPRELRSVVACGPETKPFPRRPGGLLISLDFELHWGVRELVRLDAEERAKLLTARAGIPLILDLFEEFSVHATWATVGLLFARSRKEAEAFRPAIRPSYCDVRLNPYQEPLGIDERDDPYHFAPSLIAQIAQRRGQEIASHSFSHYYCMEKGQTAEQFEADLQSAVAIAANSGYATKSYVFPRNQANSAYLSSLERSGIWSYRGNEVADTKKSAAREEQRRLYRRALRLLDAHVDIDGYQTFPWPNRPEFISIPASRYLRPYHPVLHPFEDLRLRRIRVAMKHAAETGEIFHLWWHPEDFASDLSQNLRVLRQVLEAFDYYRTQYGMVSLSMAEVSSLLSDEQFPARAS